MKFLIIDDSKLMRTLTENVLRENNHEVFIAENGINGIEQYKKLQPDGVLLDITMPIIDGCETLTRLLKVDANAKVVMLTMLEHDALMDRCLSKGALGYIIKPLNQKHLPLLDDMIKTTKGKNIPTFFISVCTTIENGLKQVFDPQASLTIKHIDLIKEEAARGFSVASKNASMVVVPDIIKPMCVEFPQDSVGYVTEITGQQQGFIASFIKSGDCDAVESGILKDFFETINLKMFSELVEETEIILNAESLREYNLNDANRKSEEVAKIIFEVTIEGQTMNVESYLFFPLRLLGRRF